MSVIKNISYSLAAFVFSKPLGFLLSFLLAKTLGPTSFGVWVTLMLFVSYCPIACLGTVETLLKQIPYYLGRREIEKVREVENSVLGSIVIAAVAIILVAAVVLTAFPSAVDGVDSIVIVMMLVTSAFSYFSGYFYNRFAAYEDFKAVGIVDFVRAVLALLFAGGLGWLWGLPGAILGYMLHEIFVCLISAVISVRSNGKVGISFDRYLLIQAVRVGFPITLLWWTLVLSNTVDRVVLGSMLGPTSVGLYGLAVSLTGTLALMPVVLGRVLYPKVNRHFGQDLGAESMKRIVLAPSFALGTLLANVQLPLLIVMPFLYNRVVPKYQDGLLAGQILVLGSFFSALIRNGANFLIAANQERVFLKYIVGTLVFNLLCVIAFVKMGFGIEGVATGTSLAGLLLTSLVWRRVLGGLEFTEKESWRKLLELYLPFILSAIVIVCAKAAYHPVFKTFNFASVLLGISLCIVLNILLYGFPIYRTEFHQWMAQISRMRLNLFEPRGLASSVGEIERAKFREDGL